MWGRTEHALSTSAYHQELVQHTPTNLSVVNVKFARCINQKAEILSENAFTTALKRLGYQGRMAERGFRGLASTSLYEMQYTPQAIELQLSHVQGNKTVRAYNEANLLPARARMMNEWADIVDEIKGHNFNTYKNKRMTGQSEQAFISFLKAIKYKDHEIIDELAVHRVEMTELMQ
ncbi:tyrosine-type recombinase/integrase [Moraxella equi]|uniref:Prophage CPS-53 integrase n=1 Tax=Moraxella equi TaxID=60442 RepID=A0A378QTK6_9GAMM|nr:hypothetical protein [Moraxella equi]OPH33351.1 hypothetical protein B5J93_12950 [Moraxella equi]STZ04185.1 Putative prophage CPS-53 integrase [Moraxella equi]